MIYVTNVLQWGIHFPDDEDYAHPEDEDFGLKRDAKVQIADRQHDVNMSALAHACKETPERFSFDECNKSAANPGRPGNPSFPQFNDRSGRGAIRKLEAVPERLPVQTRVCGRSYVSAPTKSVTDTVRHLFMRVYG